MKVAYLRLRLLLLFALSTLCLSLYADESRTIRVEKEMKRALAKASKYIEELKKSPGYKPINTQVYRSRNTLPASIDSLSRWLYYATRLKSFQGLVSKVQAGDTVTFKTLQSYKYVFLGPKPNLKGELLDGWVALHRYTIWEGGEMKQRAKLYFFDEKLDRLIDVEHWRGLDYEMIVKVIDSLKADIVKPTLPIGEQTFDKIEEFTEGDKNAEFPGGFDELRRYVFRNLSYPDIAGHQDIHGRVVIQFVVEKDGSITNVVPVRLLDPWFDIEAVRIVLSMPKWKPATRRGRPIRARAYVVVVFPLL